MKSISILAVLGSAFLLASPSGAQVVPADGPALGSNRVTQEDIVNGVYNMKELRRRGMEIFSTPFNKLDGFGDGPWNDSEDHTALGGRPTFQTGVGPDAQSQGTFLRMNGLDTQTCLECHSVLSNRSLPATFSVGGAGGIGASAFPGPTDFDVDASDGNPFATFNGRVINPPFVFGAGGVELLGKEMTADLQALRAQALANPGTPVDLVTKGVDFGTIVSPDGVSLDTSGVEGIDDNLVVQPFGRKGNNATIRVFDTGALQFHHGMQPSEVVGDGVDADGDGVANEILPGELSALHVFSVNLERPSQEGSSRHEVQSGFQQFQSAGCADCHVPELDTSSRNLPLSFPEVATDPLGLQNPGNVYAVVDLTGPAGFKKNGQGGVIVPLFSDLKRHDMGPALTETNGDALASQFITPRLWGVADSAPYLHDGRAMTLREAIGMHGGEAQYAADNFAGLSAEQQANVLEFLQSLRTPHHPSRDIL